MSQPIVTQIPPRLDTQARWRRKGRKVPPRTVPVAILQITNKTPDLRVKERDTAVGLYSLEQTRPYTPTPKTRAVWQFYDWFVTNQSKRQHLWWSKKAEDWRSPHGPLSEGQISSHCNGSQQYGVYGGNFTQFVALDLDLHIGRDDDGNRIYGDPVVLMRHLEVLLDELHRENGWHVQVADELAGGVHFIRTFPHPLETEKLRERTRQFLVELDAKHPELRDEALKAGMKSLSAIEIYPGPSGFRLPLASGRKVLLDKPTRDVEEYVSWLKNPVGYMAKDEVLAHVKDRLHLKTEGVVEKQVKDGAASKSNGAPAKKGQLGQQKNSLRKTLVGFFSGEIRKNGILNEAIILAARILPFEGLTMQEAVQLLEQYVDDLPDKNISSRLLTDRADVSRTVQQAVDLAYGGNLGQPDPEKSTRKLKAVVAYWKSQGFRFSDKTTWTAPSQPPTVRLTDNQKTEVVNKLLSTLRVTPEKAFAFVEEVLTLVARKERTQNGIAISLFKIIAENHGVKCGHHEKINAIVQMLLPGGLNLIKRVSGYRIGKRAIRYALVPCGEPAQGSNWNKRKRNHSVNSVGDRLLTLSCISPLPYVSMYILSHFLREPCLR